MDTPFRSHHISGIIRDGDLEGGRGERGAEGWEGKEGVGKGRKGKGKFVQGRCGWRRGSEHHGGREGRKEGKGRKDLFRIGVVGNGSLNSTEGG